MLGSNILKSTKQLQALIQKFWDNNETSIFGLLIISCLVGALKSRNLIKEETVRLKCGESQPRLFLIFY